MLALAFAITLFAQAGNPIVQNPAPADIHVTNTTVLQVPPMDPQAVSDAAEISNQSFVVNTVQPIPVQWANSLCSLPDIWRTTPPQWTYQQSELRTLAIAVNAAAFALIVFAIFARGLSLTLGQGFEGGRVVFAAIMCAGNLIWWEIGIRINNAISAAISPPDLCGGLIRAHIQLQTVQPDPGQSLASPVLVIVYAVVSIMLLLSLVMRLAMLDVMLVLGPLAMITWADPHTEYLAQWYAKISAGTLFGQILLVVGLVVAQVLSRLGTGAAGTLLAIAVLWLCRKLLTQLGGQTAQGSGRAGLVALTAVRRLVTRFV